MLGIGAGYALSACFGMVNFQSVGEAAVFQLPQLLYFGIDFEISACVAIGILFGINAVQAIGDLTATTVGAMERSQRTGNSRTASWAMA